MKTIKILFADDDLKYSMLLKRFLEAEGYEVTYAGNGNIALQQFPLIRPQTTELKQKAIHSEKVHLTIPPMK